MKSLTENWIVKTVYAYLNLFKKLLPIVVLLFTILKIIPPYEGKNELKNFDVFNILDSHFEQTYSENVLMIILIILFDLVIVAGLYMILTLMTKFIKNVFNNNPFVEENGIYLKSTAKIILALTFVYHLMTIVSAPNLDLSVSWIIDILFKAAMILSVVFNPVIVIGLFLFVIGEIIIQAANIKQENDLTV